MLSPATITTPEAGSSARCPQGLAGLEQVVEVRSQAEASCPSPFAHASGQPLPGADGGATVCSCHTCFHAVSIR